MNKPKVLFFDVNETLLDLSPLKDRLAELVDGQTDLLALWFSSFLHHTLVLSAAKQYTDFATIGGASLQMIAKNKDIDVDAEKAATLIKVSLRSLKPHAEVEAALKQLKAADYRLITLTNSSQAGIDAQLNYAGLTPYFEQRLSVESVGLFKPHLETYQFACKQAKVKPEEALLVAAHGWDIAGARYAGLRAVFIERPGKQLFPLAPEPEFSGTDLGEVANYLLR